MYTEQQIQNEIREWLKEPSNREYVRSQGGAVGYTQEDMLEVAERLKKDIVEAFLSQVVEPGARFDESSISIKTQGEDHIIINFSSKGLHRDSLFAEKPEMEFHTDRGGDVYTGEGIRDIFALFTTGITKRKNPNAYVYGSWYASNGSVYQDVRAKLTRKANPFISNVINFYRAMYPDVKIKIPKSWGG